MKLVFVLTVVCLGTAWAHPGWMSAVTGATSALQHTATNAAKATTNAAVNTAKATTNAAVNTAKATSHVAVDAAKATTNMAINAAESAKNMTVNAAQAGVNLVKNISMSAINTGSNYLIQQVKKVAPHTIPIPPISVHKYGVGFSAGKGYFRDITSLVKAGVGNVTTNSTDLKLVLGINLDNIDIGYDQVNVTALGVTAHAGIKVHVEDNAFLVHLRLHPGFTCALNVEKVVVANLSGIRIDFTNVGATSEWILEKVSNLVLSSITSRIQSNVQSAVDSALKKALKEDSTICSKFLG